MPGPVEQAYLDLIARLQMGDVEGQIKKAVETAHPTVKPDIDEAHIRFSARKAGDSAGREIDNSLERAFKRVVAFGIAGLVTRGAVQATEQLISAGLQAAGAIETVQVSLNRFFAQSANLGETAGAFFQDLRKVALETPFQFQGLAETSRRILAMGVSAKDTTNDLVILSDAVAGVGGAQEDIDGVVKALSQLSSKGKIDLQDFRQISERLPSLSRQMQIQGVVDEINKLHPGLNATASDFAELRKSGLVTGQALRDGIIGAIAEIPGVSGAARAASRTLQGSLSNLKDFAQVEFAGAFSGLGRELADQLNLAFGSATGAGQLSPLAGAISQVIQAFGRAGEQNFSDVLESIVRLAPEAATLVQALSGAVHEGIGLLASLGAGAVTSLTGAASSLKTLGSLLNLLPTSVVEGFGSFLTTAVVLNHTIGVDVLGSFHKLATGARQALQGVKEGEEAVALGAASMNAALTFGAVIGVQLLFDQLNASEEQSRKFAEGVSAATTSIKEMASVGEAALGFLKQFDEAGKKPTQEPAFLGDTESIKELDKQLGITTPKLAQVVEILSRIPQGTVIPPEVSEQLKQLGVDLNKLGGDSSDATNTLFTLTDQFRDGARAALEAAIGSQQYALVTDAVAKSIQDTASRTGDYVGGLDALKAANEAVAKSEVDRLSRGMTPSHVRQIISANTDLITNTVNYLAVLQAMRGELRTTDDAFTGLGEDFPGFTEAFARLNSETGNLGDKLVKFALDAENAGLSTDQLNAIANKLTGTLANLSGADLGKLFKGIKKDVDAAEKALDKVVPVADDVAEAFSPKTEKATKKLDDQLKKLNETFSSLFTKFPGFTSFLNELNNLSGGLGASLVNVSEKAEKAGLSAEELTAISLNLGGALGKLTGDQLGKLFTGVTKKVDEFKSELESVIPSVKDLQHNMLVFSLAAFLRELDKLATARASVVSNISFLLDQFGDLGARAIDALASSGLNSGQFALALSQTIQGGLGSVQDVVNKFGAATAGDLQGIAERMTAAGLTPEKVNEMLGIDAFGTASDQIGTDVQKIEVTVDTSVDKVQDKLNGFSLDAFLAELDKIGKDRAKVEGNINQLLDEFGPLGAKALEALTSSGLNKDQFAVALDQALSGGEGKVKEIVDKFGAATGDELRDTAVRLIALGLKPEDIDKILGTNAFEEATKGIGTTLRGFGDDLATGLDAIKTDTFTRGLGIGDSLIQGFNAGVAAAKAAAIMKTTDATKSIIDAANAALDSHSPSRVFMTIGQNAMLGLALGIERAASLPANAISNALAGTTNGLVPAALPFAASGTAGPASSAAAPTAGDHTIVTVDARGSGADYWSGLQVGKGVADQMIAMKLRFPRR